MENVNFKIRVVENIGKLSKSSFGEVGTEFNVANGIFRDICNYPWGNGSYVYKNIDDINKHLGAKDSFQTVFELVEVSE